MGYVLPSITAPDNYTTTSTIENVPIEGFTLDVANAAILWQVKLPVSASDTAGNWEENVETPMLPGSRRITGHITGIRIRAQKPAGSLPPGAFQAVVTVRTFP